MKKIISFLLFISFMLTFSGCKKDSKNIDFNTLSEETTKTKYLEKPTIGRPKAQKPKDNIFIALNTLKEATYYESTTSGEVKAKKTITLATQKLKNKKILTPSASFNESISVSDFVKVAEQIYISNDSILKRDAKKISSASKITWKNNVTNLTQEDYLKEYGYSFTDPTKYIINEKTIISDIEILNNGLGRKYTYKFKLDPQIAPYYYKTTIKKLSNSSSDPNFKSIEMTITFDYKWRISEIETKEIYEVTISPLGTVTCIATMTETFKNINKHITIDEKNFFNSKL